MTSPDQPIAESSVDKPSARMRRGWIGAVIVMTLALCFVGAGIGFVAFLSQLRATEMKPSSNADGIVVLTGGSSRVSDAMELLASGYGKRLLISGVHPTNGVTAITRSLRDSEGLMTCCVDLDRSAVNTRSNAAETRRWAQERNFHSLIVVTSNYHMPRAIVEMSHAMPDVTLIPFSVIGEKWREEPWWTSAGTLRLLLSEYVKYVAAETRIKLVSQIRSSPDRVATSLANFGFDGTLVFLNSSVVSVRKFSGRTRRDNAENFRTATLAHAGLDLPDFAEPPAASLSRRAATN